MKNLQIVKQIIKNKKSLLLLLILIFFNGVYCSAFSFDPQSAAFSISAENKDLDTITDAQKINELLDSLEKNWSSHNIDKVLSHYDDNFINGDGIPLESVKKLTTELWEAYPDVKSKSQERSVRVFGEYATVDSTDIYEGTSAKIRQEVGTKGTLKAVSIGQLFLKKFGPTWKITSDKTIFEKVSIGYGEGSDLINQNKIKLSSPEQVAAGQPYTARLDFNLPDDIKPVSAISKEVLVYPQVSVEDKFRLITETGLERLLTANKINKNELLTATVGLTGGALKPKLLGLVFLTRRVNVIPVSSETSEVSIIKTPAKSALNKDIDQPDIYTDEQDKQKKERNNPKPSGSDIPEIEE